jgi:hypothetical protein
VAEVGERLDLQSRHVTERALPRSSKGRAVRVVLLGAAFVAAAIVGGYLDWIWWPVYSGLTVTLWAIGLLVIAVVAATIRRGPARLVSLAAVAVGLGLLAGQNLGPSHEPLILHPTGTITLRVDSPESATASGPADCTTVASGTEFQITGDPNIRLDTPDRPFVSVYINKGDRWEVLGSVPRKDGVRLSIAVTPELVSDDGKPSTIGMAATETSTLQSTFQGVTGSIVFTGLEPENGPDYNGESLDLAGRIDWTCGKPIL